MNEEFNMAFSLLAVGMITVFIVLALVVATGNLLIRIVNKFITGGKQFDQPTRFPAHGQRDVPRSA